MPRCCCSLVARRLLIASSQSPFRHGHLLSRILRDCRGYSTRVELLVKARAQTVRSSCQYQSHGAGTAVVKHPQPARPRMNRKTLLSLLFLPFFDEVHCEDSFPSLDQVSKNSNGYETREDYLLSASDNLQVLSKRIPENSVLKRIYLVVDSIFDTLGTCLRFLHLVIIFVPVIAGSPAILCGHKVSTSDNETTGALWWYKLLIKHMERAGPTFIKLGQWAASRTDIFPKMMCVEMSKLHSHVKQHSLAVTKRAIVEAFHGERFENIFEEFIEKPLGIGAIAQVYRAKLSPAILQNVPPKDRDNAWVAVKVLHPGVENRVYRDLQIMKFFAAALNLIPTIEWLSLPDEVEKFGEMMRQQLDLRIESTNLAIFQQNFAHRDGIHFPVSYSALLPNMNSRRVLIEEYVPAIPMGKILQLPSEGRVQMEEEIADMGLNAFLNMLLIDNFVHADLHPGNIMVRLVKVRKLRESLLQQDQRLSRLWNRDTSYDVEATNKITDHLRSIDDPVEFRKELVRLDENGYRPQIVFLDAGLVTELNERNRRNFLDLFTALATFDGYRAGELMCERSRTPATVIDSEVFALKMQRLLLSVKSKTFALGNIKISDVLNEVLTMVRKHHVRMEGDFVNVVISVLLLEGIGRQLDPNLDIFSSALPILRRLGAQSSPQMLKDHSLQPMLKVWVALEARQFVTGSAQDIKRLVRYDLLCPNI
ncbi:ABC1 family-domain-containing protein [Lipomyces orientalis]|uniref:ABC1 family-domain-containing protein n=1 Tax=Lipomyces orientalis TaxID=1233043 RepID=A0ACC3TTK1_9ASCO